MTKKLGHLVVGILGLIIVIIGTALFASGTQVGVLLALLGITATINGLIAFGRANPK